jgi:signal transduction histidine kinase/CheY-like chemotaxis protein
MSEKSKSVKQKVITGYVLLFLMGVLSIGFLYDEIVKANSPQIDIALKNQQLLDLSDALVTLYEAESSSRNREFITSEKGFSKYNELIDNAIKRMQNVNKQESFVHNIKLDSIAILLGQKKVSIGKIRDLYLQYNNESNFSSIKVTLQKVRDSLRKATKRIDFTKSSREIEREFGDFISEILTESQMDSLGRPFITDTELLNQYDQKLTELILKEDILKAELLQQEHDLQIENQVLSNKIQVLLKSLEDEILDKSYLEIIESQNSMERTTLVLLWVGVLGVILLVVFGWIILKDLAKQQEYRKKLEELNNENAMLLRSKTMLLATVTHDLQTPLGSILGFSDLMKKTLLDTTQKQYLSNISSSSEYILNLVNDLVDFSKLENNRIKIQEVTFNPKQLVETIFNLLKQNALDKDILLLYDVEPSLDTNLISDPYRVKQVLTNLISNAIKFTQNGHVKIVGKKVEDKLVFEIQDSGIGITEEQQTHIFKEFTQAHPDIEKQFGGTGLGLTISKRMVNLLGGTISVESELGKGSVFTFSIPYIKDKNHKADIQIKDMDASFLEGKKILVVDDDRMQLSLIEALFSTYPINLTTLNDATKVIPLLGKEHYDLVFTDIQMPKKSGFELIRKIRNNTNLQIQNIPVIALSGKRDLNLEDFTKRGFTYFVEKPLQMNKAFEVLEYIFRGTTKQPETTSLPYTETDKLYDLTLLNQLLLDDSEAVKEIIKVFLDTTEKNIEELRDNTDNIENLAQIAHRMIPMLKQIECYDLVLPLEKLEDKLIAPEETEQYGKKIINTLRQLVTKLETELS